MDTGKNTWLGPAQKVAFVISGGGFRATLFHLGSLIRLNELGLLSRFSHVSSVSGGSILAGQLGRQWNRLSFDAAGVAQNLQELVVDPLLAFCSRRVDIPAVLRGVILMGGQTGKSIAMEYDKLFEGAKLSELPDRRRGNPVFFINSTNLQTGSVVYFTRSTITDAGNFYDQAGDLSLATAVAASSAFPPVLSPLKLARSKDGWSIARREAERAEADLEDSQAGEVRADELPPGPEAGKVRSARNWRAPDQLYLTDGGVYDNLGLEPVWHKRSLAILCSDASGVFRKRGGPFGFIPSQLLRIVEIFNRQSYEIRLRYFKTWLRGTSGAYWSISTQLDRLRCHPMMIGQETPEILALAAVGTRLQSFGDVTNRRLVNWGYVLADTALRKYTLGPDMALGVQPFNQPPYRL